MCPLILGVAFLIAFESPLVKCLNNADFSISARIEVEGSEKCCTVRFYIKNDEDKDIDIIVGRGRTGRKVITLHYEQGSHSLEITPPVFKAPGSRAMRPDLLKLPAHKEVLYDTYRFGFPEPGKGMKATGRATMIGEIVFEVPNERVQLRLRTKEVPFLSK